MCNIGYTEEEMDKYNDYLDEVRERVIYLNGRINNPVKQEQIEFSNIKNISREEWGFTYKIWKSNLPEPTKKAIGPIKGSIRFESFNIWMAVKKAQQREDKLKQLGI
jgi:hypothetical protein